MNPLMANNINLMQMFDQFKRDPIGALRQAGYSVPAEMNDPRQIIDHLTRSGQVNNGKIGQLNQLARRFGVLK